MLLKTHMEWIKGKNCVLSHDQHELKIDLIQTLQEITIQSLSGLSLWYESNSKFKLASPIFYLVKGLQLILIWLPQLGTAALLLSEAVVK